MISLLFAWLYRSFINHIIEGIMPSVPIYIREANCEKIRKAAEKTGKTIGQIINELTENNLNTIFKTNTTLTHIKNGWRARSYKVDHFKNIEK